MKKLTLLVAAIATLFSTSLFTSCSEPESNEPSIVGTWEYKETYDNFITIITFVFNTDGSGSYNILRIEGTASYQRSVSFEYSYNNETYSLILIATEANDIAEIFETDKIEAHLTANKLKFTMYYQNADSYSLVFSRVK